MATVLAAARYGTRESDEGYAWGPGPYNPDAVTFEQITHVPCLALLGEPGIGKSKTVEREFMALQMALGSTDDRAVLINLRSYGSEDRLVRALFESSEFRQWAAGTYRLHLFLDSLDECLLRIDYLPPKPLYTRKAVARYATSRVKVA